MTIWKVTSQDERCWTSGVDRNLIAYFNEKEYPFCNDYDGDADSATVMSCLYI